MSIVGQEFFIVSGDFIAYQPMSKLISIVLTASGFAYVFHAFWCSFDIDVASLGTKVSYNYAGSSKLGYELKGFQDSKLYGGLLPTT